MAHKPRHVNLALQGVGAHGAFTWGVLDRILDDGRLQIAGVSGTSAGAMNAVALADGFTRDGKLSKDEYRQVRVHIIENEAELKPLHASSKMNVEWAFLTKLRDIGRDTARRWLDENFAAIGERSAVDLREMFQVTGTQYQGG